MKEKALDKEQLKRMYIEKRMPINVIMTLLSSDYQKLKKYLNLYGFKRRPLEKFGKIL